jgi:amidophosphoribosyltransferase
VQTKSTYRQSDSPGEECGIFGVFGVDRAASQIHRGLFSLQHRGQEGCGIVVSDGHHVLSHKGEGLVGEVFSDPSVIPQEWGRGIGHVRYSTTGSTRIYNVQPLVVECVDGIWALAHNGNLTNADKLRRMYQDAGAIFQTSTDSEVLVHILADPMYRRRPQRVARALAELRGAFAFLIMTKDCVMAARDPYGFRPLSIGKLGDGYVFASETCAMAQTGAEYLRDVEPGELVTVDETGLHSSMFADPPEHKAHCVFEMVYFARPDSVVFGNNVHAVRMQYGARLAEEYPVEADIVIPVPDSGNSAALGYSRASGIPFDFGFIRNHYIGRTFIMPQAEQRATGVDLKLAVLPEVVRGKRVVVVDDSIVRGTTVKRRVAWLRSAGAKEVHVSISCPPVAHPCFYGIDFPTREELIAGGRTVEDIREFIGADSLGYLSEEGLLSPFENASDYCKACFSGDYPLSVEGLGDKHRHESVNPELPFDR